MKQFFLISILLLSITAYSQSSLKTSINSYSHPEQYLWSFSKNKAIPNEKKMIDFSVMDNWRGMGDYLAVSDDGSYFAYTIKKTDVREGMLLVLDSVDTLVIQSTKNGQRSVFTSIDPGSFTADSKEYVFRDGDALCFLQLGAAKLRKIEGIGSYRISQDKWLAYQLKSKTGLILRHLTTGKEKQFPGITEYGFDGSGTWLVCKNNAKAILLFSLEKETERRLPDAVNYVFSADGKTMVVKTNANLQYVNLPQEDVKNIWTIKEKTGFGNYSVDASGKKVLFTVIDSTDVASNMIGYYEQGMNGAVVKISKQTEGIHGGFTIRDASFTDNGKYIKLSLQAKPDATEKPNTEMAGVEVWNSKDENLQSMQSRQLNSTATYNAIANIENGKIVFLERSDKKLDLLKGDFAIVKTDYTEKRGDRFWERGVYKDSTWLVSLKDGSKQVLPTRAGSENFWFSPGGNYLIYFDIDKGSHYFSYNLHSGELKDISANIAENQLNLSDRVKDIKVDFGNLAAWIENDLGVLVYDDYDIWKLDLTGKEPAINVTNKLGRSNSIMFTMLASSRFNYGNVPVIKIDEPLLLRAFNTRNKQSGFYQETNLNAGNLKPLYMGNYFMNKIMGCHDPNLSNEGLPPVKIKTANIWIVQRQSSNDAPNYYATSDFKNFKRLTNFQPQKNYQWFSEELITYKNLDGTESRGILYKPENFDPKKKYPVLVPFYGAFSNNMYQFPVPSYIFQSMAPGLSPIWFLNNGYLVFTPDITVTPLQYGPKAYSVIEGAAQYLRTLPYVDGNKLGTGTHSWSGKLGAYIFTHSKTIAATAITEGFLYANPMVQYLSSKSRNGGLESVENGQQYGSLWKNKEEWLDQTTVLNADKSISPLLLLCNKQSAEDYQEQTFQFFNSLRRLEKKVWWLKYDNGDHTLGDPMELKDYTIRYTQFFDHYLKNAPAPTWMTQGIPLKLKQVESRYELDPQGQCNPANGEPCPICEAWNRQYARTPEMFKKEIKDWTLDADIAAELDRKIAEKRKILDKEGEIQTKQVMEMLNK